MENGKLALAKKARLGDITYYILSMKVGRVVEIVKIYSDLPESEGADIEEIFQRRMDYNRIRKHIAPYLVKTGQRFFGAIIVTVRHFSDRQFTSLEKLMAEGSIQFGSKFAKPDRKDFLTTIEDAGIIAFTGKEELIALDGQHRIKALEMAIGKGDLISEPNFQPKKSLAEENLCVILFSHERERARKIFKDLNSNARATTMSENIIVNDDDVIACITREIANKVIRARLVHFSSNALSKKSHCFTTLVTIYKATEAFINHKFNTKLTAAHKRELPSASKVRIYQREARRFWQEITEAIDDWRLALEDKGSRGDDDRAGMRARSLLGRPLVQLALIKAYVRLREDEMEHMEALAQLNKIDWSVPPKDASQPEWHSVCMTPTGRITSKKMPLAIKIIAYMAGEDLNQRSKQKLLEDYQDNHWNPDPKERDKVQLPPQVSQ